jgi:hypothetical protein
MDTLLGRRGERQFKGAKDDFLADVLFAGQASTSSKISRLMG